jgi:hypothetical protein
MTFIAALILALAPQDQDRIQDLIKKLGSDDFATREQASEELKKAGKGAREALQKAAQDSEDPEVRTRAKDILEEMAKAPPRRAVPTPAPFPGRPGVRASSVSVRSVNGDTTYTITPGDGTPALNFFKSAAGAVKLDFTDEQGASKTAEADSLAAFLKDHKDLAQKFGISEDGIDYAGSRVSFKGAGAFPFPRLTVPQRPGRAPAPPPVPSEEPEQVPVAGASLSPVDDAMRAQLDIPEGQGAVVTSVTSGGLADALGLRKNDVVLEIDGKKIAAPADARGKIRKDSSVVVLRKGKRETLAPKKDF